MSTDLTDKVTVFVTTVGDVLNFEDCIVHLNQQTSTFNIEVIRNVAPMSAAFQMMIDRCSSPYYVQVDEDMILYPSAIESLYEVIIRSHKRVAIVCAPLFDCEINMPIYGIKIYRHDTVKDYSYSNVESCEVEQVDRLTKDGYYVLHLPLSQGTCIGEHGKHYSNATIFDRWQRLFAKHRRTAHVNWIESWPKILLQRYCDTGDELHLFALLGAISGITYPLQPDTSIDYRAKSAAFSKLSEYFSSHTIGLAGRENER